MHKEHEGEVEEERGGVKETTHSGFVALIGAPNSGKSTLLNQLVGTKLSIVTHKVQTTRAVIRGIVQRDKIQIIFMDTPGLFKPRRFLDRKMVQAAWEAAHHVDCVCLLVDATEGVESEKLTPQLFEALRKLSAPKILVLNKIDRVRPQQLLPLAQEVSQKAEFAHVMMISAKTGSGTEDLLKLLARAMPEGPFLYPADSVTDISIRLLAAEITREQLLLRLHQELPYMMTVETTDLSRFKNGALRLEQSIIVAREGHRPIVLGHQGQTIRSISTAARREMEKVFGRSVHLFLSVQLKENWLEDPERLRQMGLGGGEQM